MERQATEEEIGKILESPVRDLGFSVRINSCLHNLGVNTVTHLICKSAEDLLCERNFSFGSLYEIQDKLAGYGLYLIGDDPARLPATAFAGIRKALEELVKRVERAEEQITRAYRRQQKIHLRHRIPKGKQ